MTTGTAPRSQPAGAPHGSKVPAVTLMFWVVKIAATTLGETGGDALSMTLHLGYAVSTGIFLALLFAAVLAQCAARRFHPALYWSVIVATTTAGTTMADYADRSLGIGYPGGSMILAALLIAVLCCWYRTTGTISAARVDTTVSEAFYWTAILLSNTLGTAAGDYLADSHRGGLGLGFVHGALVFAVLLLVVMAAYFRSGRASRVRASPILFWAAFILTRPLGATLGDLLTKPAADGGYGLGRIGASLAITVFIAACVMLAPQRAASSQTNGAPLDGAGPPDALGKPHRLT